MHLVQFAEVLIRVGRCNFCELADVQDVDGAVTAEVNSRTVLSRSTSLLHDISELVRS